jgi:hypothetical protein
MHSKINLPDRFASAYFFRSVWRMTMNFRFKALLLMVATSLSFVSYSYAECKCDPAGNQQEMYACVEDDFKKADLELNKVNKAILQKEKRDVLFIKIFSRITKSLDKI